MVPRLEIGRLWSFYWRQGSGQNDYGWKCAHRILQLNSKPGEWWRYTDCKKRRTSGVSSLRHPSRHVVLRAKLKETHLRLLLSAHVFNSLFPLFVLDLLWNSWERTETFPKPIFSLSQTGRHKPFTPVQNGDERCADKVEQVCDNKVKWSRGHRYTGRVCTGVEVFFLSVRWRLPHLLTFAGGMRKNASLLRCFTVFLQPCEPARGT